METSPLTLTSLSAHQSWRPLFLAVGAGAWRCSGGTTRAVRPARNPSMRSAELNRIQRREGLECIGYGRKEGAETESTNCKLVAVACIDDLCDLPRGDCTLY